MVGNSGRRGRESLTVRESTRQAQHLAHCRTVPRLTLHDAGSSATCRGPAINCSVTETVLIVHGCSVNAIQQKGNRTLSASTVFKQRMFLQELMRKQELVNCKGERSASGQDDVSYVVHRLRFV